MSSVPLQKDLFDPMMEFKQVLPLGIRVELRVIAVKRYFTLTRSPELETHHLMQFSLIPRTPLLVCGGGLAPLQRQNQFILNLADRAAWRKGWVNTFYVRYII